MIEATWAGALLNASCAYRDEARKLTVTVEFPIELINFDEKKREVPGLHRAGDPAGSGHLGRTWA